MITGGIQGTYRERLHDELGLHSLVKRRCCNKLFFFYKKLSRLLPDYLYSYLDFSSQENYLLKSSSISIIRPVPTLEYCTCIFKIFHQLKLSFMKDLYKGLLQLRTKDLNKSKTSQIKLDKNITLILDFALILTSNAEVSFLEVRLATRV